MNVFSDCCPVSWNALMSFAAPAPDVHPESKIPVWRLASFRAHFAATLLVDWCVDVVVVRMVSVVGSDSFSSCSSTWQDDSGDQ
jgi:hypothetical protein